MSVTHIEHIGIAVKDLEVAIPLWEKLLGVKCYNIEEVAEQKVKTAFFKVGEVKIELLQSTSEDGTVAKFIERSGEGIHHLAFATDSIESELCRCEEIGMRLIDKTPRGGAEGLSIGFIHPKSVSGVLTELCEDKNNK